MEDKIFNGLKFVMVAFGLFIFLGAWAGAVIANPVGTLVFTGILGDAFAIGYLMYKK